MAEFFANVKSRVSEFLGGGEEPAEMKEGEQEYVELDPSASASGKDQVTVRPFVINSFEDIKGVLNCLREGSTIALINIKPLKDNDIVELKRAINKLKKTTDAISGDLVGFHEDYIVATPSFAKIHRDSEAGAPSESATAEAGSPESKGMA